MGEIKIGIAKAHMIQLVFQSNHQNCTSFKNIIDNINKQAKKDNCYLGELASRFFVVIDDEDGMITFLHPSIFKKILPTDNYYEHLLLEFQQQEPCDLKEPKPYFKYPARKDMERLLDKYNNTLDSLNSKHKDQDQDYVEWLQEERKYIQNDLAHHDIVEHIFEQEYHCNWFPDIADDIIIRARMLPFYAEELKPLSNIEDDKIISSNDEVNMIHSHTYYGELVNAILTESWIMNSTDPFV